MDSATQKRLETMWGGPVPEALEAVCDVNIPAGATRQETLRLLLERQHLVRKGAAILLDARIETLKAEWQKSDEAEVTHG